jgi:hypothetical protein
MTTIVLDNEKIGQLRPIIELEAYSLREFATKPVVVLPMSCEHKDGINIVTLQSAYNVDKIKAIATSDTRLFSGETNTFAITVLMMGDVIDMPLITMYLCSDKSKLSLKEWLIINNQGKQRRYTIQKNQWPSVRRKKIDVER